jgi:hypothetical protein
MEKWVIYGLEDAADTQIVHHQLNRALGIVKVQSAVVN